MAIETQFTIRSVSVEQALKEAEAKVDRSAKKMDDSLSSVGSGTKGLEKNLQNAAKGMDAVSKAGGKAGGVLKNITQGITGMLSPIGIVSAAITGVIALFVKMHEQAKQRLQALKDYASGSITDAEKRMAEAQRGLATDRGYMERLIEISHYEQIDNATKEEAIRIISMLTSRYGDLGISIDQTTGKVIGLDAAIEKFNRKQLNNEGTENHLLIQKHRGLVDTQDAELQKQMKGGFLTSENEATLETFSPMTPQERSEQFVAQQARVAYGRMGLTPPPEQVATPLNDERAIRAARRERRYFADMPEVMRDFATAENDKYLIDLLDYFGRLDKLIKNPTTSKQDKEAYMQEIDYLYQLAQAYNRAKVAEEMMEATKENPEIMKKWKERRDAALEYRRVLERGVEFAQKLRSNTADPRDKVIADRGREAQDLLKQTRDAEKKRAAALEKQYETETANERATMSRDELQEAYEIDNTNVLDQIQHEEQELESLKEEYEAMTETLKEYDQYKNEKGDIEDKNKNAEYLELSNKITANKLAQVEAETRIAEAQTEQLGIQAKLKAIEEQRNKEQREQIMNRMKTTLKGLFSNVLGDLSEKTNSLTQRGGYLSGVNTINALQVNRQILNTVMTANSYLASIKQALANVGRI